MGGIQITAPISGSLSAALAPADFERFAAQIRPIWELDDAPFAATAAMNAVDLASLQAGGGANADVAAALNGAAAELLPSDLLVTEPLAPAASNGAAQRPAYQPPQPVQTLASQPPLYAPPPASVRSPVQERPPKHATSSYSDDDDIQIKKSKAPLFIGGAVVLAVIGTIIGVVASGAPPPAPTPQKPVATTAAPTATPVNIPPPLPLAETPPSPEPAVAAAPAAPAAPASPTPAAPPNAASLPPLPPPVRAAQATPPPRPPQTHTPPVRPPPAAPKPPPKTGGIVRDNPF